MNTQPIRRKAIAGFSLFLGILCVFIAEQSTVLAAVTGECANCHTMHNSQDGAAVAHAGIDTGSWNGGQLTGGSDTGPQANLLVASCVACHSSSNNQTIVNVGNTTIPIVYNFVEPDSSSTATTPLAGGNFYWVTNDDSMGHNVFGISAQDQTLTSAPGRPSAGCAPCHNSLAVESAYVSYWDKQQNGGCEACHVPRHHANGNAVVKGQAEGWYRMLGSVMQAGSLGSNDVSIGVIGIEDDDWEQTNSPADHNVYQGTSFVYGSGGMGSGLSQRSIAQLCMGCHARFHHHNNSTGTNLMNTDTSVGVDSSTLTGVWIRHPSDVHIEDNGEYAGFTDYNPMVAIGRENVAASDANFQTIDHTRDVVTCISCHRPHGSPNPDMLRWDYDGMLAHDVNADTGDGCFVCHTQKDDF